MEEKIGEIIFYEITFEKLTLNFLKRKERLYQLLLILKITIELQKRNCYPKKINKPTKHGTTIKFYKINEKNIKEAEKILNGILEDYLKKYGDNEKIPYFNFTNNN